MLVGWLILIATLIISRITQGITMCLWGCFQKDAKGEEKKKKTKQQPALNVGSTSQKKGPYEQEWSKNKTFTFLDVSCFFGGCFCIAVSGGNQILGISAFEQGLSPEVPRGPFRAFTLDWAASLAFLVFWGFLLFGTSSYRLFWLSGLQTAIVQAIMGAIVGALQLPCASI